MPRLQIITVSTRPVRVGEPVAAWFLERARAHGKFEVEPVDLRELGLPHLDEPKHPRFGQYEHDHTRRWSAMVRAADAFVWVTPEYNFSSPPSLLNAVDFLHAEWAYKAASFVSYGAASGGTRSVQMSKQVLTAVKVMCIPEAVAIPFVSKQIENGAFQSTEIYDQAAAAMLDELWRWTEALQGLRDQSRSR